MSGLQPIMANGGRASKTLAIGTGMSPIAAGLGPGDAPEVEMLTIGLA